MKQKYASTKCEKCGKKVSGRKPRQETIDFILSYSKALTVKKVRGIKLEMMLN